jgi:hypothetical protein
VRERPKDDASGDKIISLLPWDITVRRARSKKQAYELLEKKDADDAIRALTEIEAYYAVKELGIESALPMLAVLEPHQIKALVDLDVWHDARADLSDLLLWLSAFREASVTQLSRAVRSLDPELLALLLRRRLLIALRSEEDDEHPTLSPEWLTSPPDEILPLIETPDRRFVIAARARDENDPEANKPIDEEERKAIVDLVETLYKDEDFEFIAGALRAGESDLSSMLEEEALRFRTGRMEDLGFVPVDRAEEIYQPLDPREVFAHEEPMRTPAVEMLLPALHAQRFANGFIQEALRAIDSGDVIRRIESELIALSNAALVAEHVEPGDLERIRKVLDRVRAYLELAVSHEADPGRIVEIARDRLLAHPIRTLFRVGFAITFELGRRARRLKASGSFSIGEGELDLLLERERGAIAALSARRPMFFTMLEDPVRSLDEPTRPIRSSEDVAKLGAILDDLERLARALDALGLRAVRHLTGAIDPPLSIERNADMWMATAAAHAVLEHGFVFEPLEAKHLVELTWRIQEDRFPAQDVERVIKEAASRVRDLDALAAVEKRIREGLRGLAEALAPLIGHNEIDPRFIGTVVRRVD